MHSENSTMARNLLTVIFLFLSANAFAAAPAAPVISNQYQYANVPGTITITANVNPGSRSTTVYAQCKLISDSVYLDYQQFNIGAGSIPVFVSLSCSNLDDGTLYNFRLRAINSQGEVFSFADSITTFGHYKTGYNEYSKSAFNIYSKYPLGAHRHTVPITEEIVIKPAFEQKIIPGSTFEFMLFEFREKYGSCLSSDYAGGGCTPYGSNMCYKIFHDMYVYGAYQQDGQLAFNGYSSCNQFASSTIDVKVYNNLVYSWKLTTSYSSRLWGVNTSCHPCGYTEAQFPRSNTTPLDLYFCPYSWSDPYSRGFEGGNQWWDPGSRCVHVVINKGYGFQDKGANANYMNNGLLRSGRIGFGAGGFEKVVQ